MQNKINKTEKLDRIRKNGRKFAVTSEIRGGINSCVYYAKDSEGKEHCLKFYPKPSEKDTRERLETERKFLEYLQTCGIDNVPIVEDYSRNENWLMTNWIKGKKPKEMNKKEIESIIEFIAESNNEKLVNERNKLRMASEALVSANSLIGSIGNRLGAFTKVKPINDTEEEVKQWIKKSITPLSKKEEEKLGCAKMKLLTKKLIASHSDVGVHNTIKREGKIYFIDFEYAGRDNIVKLIADWIYQPEHNLDKFKKEYIIEKVDERLGDKIQSDWKTQLRQLEALICLKWGLIILNQHTSEKDLKEKLLKARNYLCKHERVLFE